MPTRCSFPSPWVSISRIMALVAPRKSDGSWNWIMRFMFPLQISWVQLGKAVRVPGRYSYTLDTDRSSQHAGSHFSHPVLRHDAGCNAANASRYYFEPREWPHENRGCSWMQDGHTGRINEYQGDMYQKEVSQIGGNQRLSQSTVRFSCC